MARNFNNTLLFESVFDSIPPENELVYSAAQALFEPRIQVIAENCNTLLGEKLPISFRVQGHVEVRSEVALSPSIIADRIIADQKSVYVRSISTCVAEGGICRRCLAGSRPDLALTPVGTRLSLLPEVILDVTRNPTETGFNVFTLSYTSDQYDKIYVFLNDVFLPPTSYVVIDNVFTYIGPVTETDIFVVRYVVNSNLAYYYWLADTYAGSVLGIRPVTELSLPLRASVLASAIPTEDIEDIIQALAQSVVGQDDSVVYLRSIKDPLEKAMLAILLGATVLSGPA